MAISFVGKNVAQSTFSNRTITLDLIPDSSPAAEVGDLLILCVATSSSEFDGLVSFTGWTPLRPWSNMKTGTTSATASSGAFYRFLQSGETQFQYDTRVGTPSAVVQIFWFRGVSQVRSFAFAGRADTGAGGTSTSAVAPAVATQAGDSILVVSHERTLSTETIEQITTDPAATKLILTENSTSTNTFLAVRSASGTSSGTTRVSYPNVHTNNHVAGHVILVPQAPAAQGMLVKYMESGVLKDMRLTVKDGTGALVTPKGVRAIQSRYKTVTDMLAAPEFFWAHRGGTRDFPEMSMHAYTQSSLLGFSVLEFSCQRTSDGVWFGIHDLHLDRTSLGATTTTLNASTMTWAQVQAYQILGSVAANNPTQPNRPYIKLTDVLDIYTNHLFVIDAKNATTYTDELLDLLDARGGPARFVTKSFGVGGSSFLALCQARGYKSWGYFYGDSLPVAAEIDKWEIIGLNYEATQPQIDQLRSALTKGQRVVAHILPTKASVDTSRAKGFDAFQCQGVVDIHTYLRPIV